MKTIRKLTAFMMIVAILLGGCTTGKGSDKNGSGEIQTVYLVDESPRSEEMLISESPSIMVEPLIVGDDSDELISPVSVDVVVHPGAGKISAKSTVGTASNKPDEVKSVWISYLELETLLKGKTQQQFLSNIGKVFDNVKGFGLNTVIVQVRPFADAIYPSDYFPWSYLATGEEGVNPGYDPLGVMVREAHKRGLRIEAWINPYRVRNAGSKVALSTSNKAGEWIAAKNGSAYKAQNGLTVFNPASKRAQDLIVNGVREIVHNYDVDGIHIDDYFYPSTGTDFDKNFDAASYKSYRSGGGNLSLENWRRSNVDILLKKMYAAIKEENKNVRFGISPQSSVRNNYDSMYLDIEKVLSTPGYCDYVCPQIYFGYDNDVQPFETTLKQWNDMIKVEGLQLYVGLAAYKLGRVDSWAGSGSKEWQRNRDMMARQLKTSREMAKYGGVVLYRYDSIFNPESEVAEHIGIECVNLKRVL